MFLWIVDRRHGLLALRRAVKTKKKQMETNKAQMLRHTRLSAADRGVFESGMTADSK